MSLKFYTNVQLVGSQFLVRGYENNRRFMSREDYSPKLYVKSNKKTKFKTLEGEYAQEICPGSVKDCREFIKQYENVENFDVYGNDRYVYQYISDLYPEEEIKFDINKVKIYTLDIEVASENGFPDVRSAAEEVLLITIMDYTTKKIITWGLGPYSHNNENLTYHQFDDEYDLLMNFIHWWMDENNIPEVITGWNSEYYDIPYLTRRIDRVLGEKYMKRLSPWGMVKESEKFIMNRNQIYYDIGGISQLDYLSLYLKFTYKKQESYRLDYIGQVELGKKKLDHSEYNTFKDFYTNGWKKFVAYNIQDVILVDSLEEKMKLIELAITMAYDAKVNYNDVFYQVRMWDAIIYNYLKKKNIVIPPKKKNDKDEKYAGAYVKDPIPGMYDWVVNFDLNSLYPHLIMQFNVSPETLIEKRHPKANVDRILEKDLDFSDYSDYSICPNGAMYRKDIRGFLPELMDKMYNERVIFKKKLIEEKKKLEEIESEMRRRGII